MLPLSSPRLGLVLLGWVMAAVLEPGSRGDGNDS
jgi:hypothetical protein